MNTLEEIRRHFEQDKFAMQLGIEILYANQEQARCRVHVPDSQKNALGRVQGGFLFTLADFTFAVAANVYKLGMVTLNGNIHFLSASTGGVLHAEAQAKQLTARLCVYEVEVFDETETRVASATFTGYLPQKKI